MHLFPSLAYAIVFGGVLGSIIGSFFNVVGMRIGTGRSMGGRSSCMSCGHVLSWYELIPIVSYIFLRGKCSVCSSRISPLYCIGEMMMAGLFIHATLIAQTWIELGVLMILACFLVGIVIYDIRHSIIPNIFTLGILGIGVVSTILLAIAPEQLPLLSSPFPFFSNSVLLDRLFAVLIVPVPFLALSYFSSGKWFGWGDVKFMLATGFVVGFFIQIEFIMLSFWIALVCVVLALGIGYVTRKTTSENVLESLFPNHRLPFAPFLCAALWVSLTGFHVIHIMLGL